MSEIKNQELLSDARVKAEIERHRWIESEKSCSDIGFEQASRDWLSRFSDFWIKENLSKAKETAKAKTSVKKRKAKLI